MVAIRDSVLVRLEKAHFAELLASSSQVSMALTRQIIRRLQTQGDRNPVPLPVTITLLPVSDGVDLRGIADKLAVQLARKGRVIVLDAGALDTTLGEPGAANGEASDAALNRRISMVLDNIESEHEFVLLLGNALPDEWTRRCCRHGDELLLLADATQAPVLHPVEIDWLTHRPPRAEAAEILVLLHPADARCPRGTQAWRNAVAVARIARQKLDRAVPSEVLWYHADYVAPVWGRNLARVDKIGAHIFYGPLRRS